MSSAGPTPTQTEPVEPARRRGIPVRVLIPNLITLMVLAAGLTSVRFAIEGRLEHSVMAIAVAALLDGLDGRIARLLKGASRFGAELDSLADFLAFGCAPALVLYFWAMHEISTLGWLAAVALAMAAALRLARFNVSIEDTTRPEWTKAFFTGVPAPAGAMLALLPINLYLSGLPRFPGHAAVVAVFTVFVAGLMVSRLPTLSGKGKGGAIPRDKVIPLVALVLALGVLLISHPFPTVAALTIAYLATLPYSLHLYGRLRAATPPAEPPR
ncbi:MAG TPA: phosphatidylcholine/phosphatidylserine synthase [Beijerinckiaceae bacterium]|nr:phosphatidylcholine/phosphatidylserine synthase [Beijerinckiaceae bacterium]